MFYVVQTGQGGQDRLKGREDRADLRGGRTGKTIGEGGQGQTKGEEKRSRITGFLQ